MKSRFVISEVIFALFLAISAASSVVGVEPTNTTLSKTPANATVFLENGTNISQPRIPVLMSPGNITGSNLSDTNITGR